MERDPLTRAVGFVTSHNRLTLLFVLLLSGVVVAGIPMLDTENRASPDADAFGDLDRVEASAYVEANYADAESGPVATVYVRNESRNVLSKPSLLAGLRYQRAVRDNASLHAAGGGDGVGGFANLVASRAAEHASPDLDAQIDALAATSPARVDALVAETLAEDSRAMHYLPADHDPTSTTAHDRRLLVAFDADASESAVSDATAALFEAADDPSRPSYFTLGDHAFRSYTSYVVGELVELVVPIALLLILSVLAFAYRDPLDVVVGMVGVALSVLWMFGIMGWLGVAAGTASIIPVVLITGLSVDFGFHVFNRYREARATGGGVRPAMRQSVRAVSVPLALVTLTAAIGFLSNLFNPIALIRDLGVSITLGVVSALVLFTTLVPALKVSVDGALARLGVERRRGALGRGRYLEPVLAVGVRLARRAAPVVLAVVIVAAAVGGLAWTSLDQEQFDGREGEVAEWKQDLPDPLGWEPYGYHERLDHVGRTYTPVGAADAARSPILVRGDVTDPDALRDVAAGVDRIRDAGLVLDAPDRQAVESPLTAMRAVAAEDEAFAAELRAADTDDDGVPDEDLAGLYDAFYAADAGRASQVVERRDGEYESLLISLTLDSTDRGERLDAVGTLAAGADEMAGDGRPATVAGQFAVRGSILDAVQSGIVATMAVAIAAVVVTLAAVFFLLYGTASLGVVISLPIVAVVGLVVGGMSLLGIPLNLLTALLMSLAIGLGVDYTIHVGDRFADELRAGRGVDAALRAAVTGTGGALLGSTLTTIGAFSTLLLVPDPGLQSFGAIVVLALATAFAVSVLVLPSALLLWHRYAGGVPAAEDAGPAAEGHVPQD